MLVTVLNIMQATQGDTRRASCPQSCQLAVPCTVPPLTSDRLRMNEYKLVQESLTALIGCRNGYNQIC